MHISIPAAGHFATPRWVETLLSSFYRWGNWGSEPLLPVSELNAVASIDFGQWQWCVKTIDSTAIPGSPLFSLIPGEAVFSKSDRRALTWNLARNNTEGILPPVRSALRVLNACVWFGLCLSLLSSAVDIGHPTVQRKCRVKPASISETDSVKHCWSGRNEEHWLFPQLFYVKIPSWITPQPFYYTILTGKVVYFFLLSRVPSLLHPHPLWVSHFIWQQKRRQASVPTPDYPSAVTGVETSVWVSHPGHAASQTPRACNADRSWMPPWNFYPHGPVSQDPFTSRCLNGKLL